MQVAVAVVHGKYMAEQAVRALVATEPIEARHIQDRLHYKIQALVVVQVLLVTHLQQELTE
jgi:hypothetical protein